MAIEEKDITFSNVIFNERLNSIDKRLAVLDSQIVETLSRLDEMGVSPSLPREFERDKAVSPLMTELEQLKTSLRESRNGFDSLMSANSKLGAQLADVELENRHLKGELAGLEIENRKLMSPETPIDINEVLQAGEQNAKHAEEPQTTDSCDGRPQVVG